MTPTPTTMTLNQALQLAVQHHQANRLAEAETLYRQILAQQPNHPGALHLLGVLAGQVGKFDLAITLISQAVTLAPGESFFRVNLSKFLLDGGRLDEAIHTCRETVRLFPQMPEAHCHLGAALFAQKTYAEAATCQRQALKLRPNFPDAHLHLGNALNAMKLTDQAIASFREALRLNPHFVDAYTNLAAVMVATRQFDEAIASCRQALQLQPQSPLAYGNLGNALRLQGHLEQAVDAFRMFVQCSPRDHQAHNSLGNALKELGRFDEAMACFRQSFQLRPDFADGYNNLGVVLQLQGKVDDAIACFRDAVRLKPDYVDAWSNLGYALKDCGLLKESADCARKALELNPQDSEAHSNLIFAMQFDADCSPQSILEECRRWHSMHTAPLARFIQPHANDRSPDRPLRIGYISPDFRGHCQTFFTNPLLSRHDHKQFHITAYSDVILPDELTEKLRHHCDEWRNIRNLPDDQVTELIRQDRIDILVDLTMHMAGNRLRVLARKPAPVQVTWLAYPGTTGVPTIDYRFTDPNLDPPPAPGSAEPDNRYSETSIRLPDTFWCYDAIASETTVNELPALSAPTLTFGCLNNFCKVNDSVLKLWSQVLNSVPASRLLLLVPEGSPRQRILHSIHSLGIASDRIDFVARHLRGDYLKLYHRIDLGLDTIPYNGHTTSLDSFWMGVPVVTLVGPTVVGRAGLCQLMNLGLPELIAHSPAQFVQIAADLAKDLPRLKQLRATLRTRMEGSPLMDAPRFARNVETAYRQMWTRWCQSPQSP